MTTKGEKQIISLANTVRKKLFPSSVYNNDSLSRRIQRYFHIDTLWTDYDKVYSYVRWNTRTHLPQIVLSRDYSNTDIRDQNYHLAIALGLLFIQNKWYPSKIIHLKSKNYILSVEPLHNEPSSSELDRAVKLFALNLLMPRNHVYHLIYSFSSNTPVDDIVQDLADEFGVHADVCKSRVLNIIMSCR